MIYLIPMLPVSRGWISFSKDELAEIRNLRITSISSNTSLLYSTNRLKLWSVMHLRLWCKLLLCGLDSNSSLEPCPILSSVFPKPVHILHRCTRRHKSEDNPGQP